ncbi:MAG TPA: pre-toxin TG domain-containing protein [Longimicrobium sp.]|nr:pre-toxin TG domain-containing protein [Longimicrobium sp.]
MVVSSTVLDAVTLVSGYNVITGEKVGWGGRAMAAIGLLTPVSGGELRGAGKLLGAAEHGAERAASHLTGRAPRLLKRWGTDWESAEKLGREAAAAAKNPEFGHGVSFSSRIRGGPDGNVVSTEALTEAGFTFRKTGNSDTHYTVYLPQPVDDKVAEAFNTVLGRTR